MTTQGPTLSSWTDNPTSPTEAGVAFWSATNLKKGKKSGDYEAKKKNSHGFERSGLKQGEDEPRSLLSLPT